MFSDLLDQDQKRTLIHVLCEVALADGELHDVETEVIGRYAASLGLPDVKIARQGQQPAEWAADAASYPEMARRIIYLEAATLALLDSEFASEEQATLQGLAERLNLSGQVAGELREHVERGFEWNATGLRLIQADR